MKPFIGHAGAGARIEVVRQDDVWVLRETIKSQIFLLVLLAMIGFYPLWILIEQTSKIKGGLFGFAVLGLAAALGIRFFIKYLVRLLGRRRIEFQMARQKTVFFHQGSKSEREISFSFIRHVRVGESNYRQDSWLTKNYWLELVCDDGSTVPLAASDNEANIREALKPIAYSLPISND